jgi:cell division protein FtsN
VTLARMPGRKLTSRDYKRKRHSSFEFGRWKEFGMGLGAGLVVALGVYVTQHRTLEPAAAAPTRPTPQKKTSDGAEADESAAQYDFYDMLPKFEVVVPEKERDVRRDLPAAPVDRPGVYVLQAGSYRNFADADRIRLQLAKQRIEAKVQRVAVDADVWHRVRIGPVNDLKEVNRLREQLRAADLDALVIRIGD